MADWQTRNAEYLSTALAWLRQVLAGAAEIADAGESAASEAGLTAAVLAVDEDSEFVPALALLGRWFGLSTFEQKLLLLCAALELDTQIASLCAQVQQSERQPYSTFALAMALFDDPEWSVVMADGALRYWQFIEVTASPTIPLTASPLRADMRIVHFLKGVNHLDSRLAALVRPMPGEALAELPPSQQATVAEAVAALERSPQQPDSPLAVQLLGTDAASQQQVALAIAQQVGVQLYRLPVAQLPTQVNELTLLARLWERETRLLSVALYFDGTEIDPHGVAANALRHFIDRCGGICLLAIASNGLALAQAAATVEVAKPTALEQRQTWELCLGEGSRAIAGQLASQFRLNLTEIHEIAAMTVSRDAALPALWQACLKKTRPNLDNLAQRLEVKATWEDLVLPAVETETLQQIAAQVRQRSQVYEDWGFRQKLSRGLGVSALFAGPSGTGKTMAAEVIANALQLHLYRIDLSAVVSKYIGETEKNLRKLFDAAEDGGAILFFDEADALFGKRSEVKDSHDRHANIEINYLLQRLEAFGGLAILATNFRNALDSAFVRRLRFIVTFPSPGPTERLRLWQKVFPAQTPLEDLDYERLAQLNLTGGNIHTVAINAAFLAARAKSAVGMAHIFAAAKGEYRKLERPIGGEEFQV